MTAIEKVNELKKILEEMKENTKYEIYEVMYRACEPVITSVTDNCPEEWVKEFCLKALGATNALWDLYMLEDDTYYPLRALLIDTKKLYHKK